MVQGHTTRIPAQTVSPRNSFALCALMPGGPGDCRKKRRKWLLLLSARKTTGQELMTQGPQRPRGVYSGSVVCTDA